MPVRRVAAGLIVCGALFAFQKPFRQYPGVEYDNFPLPQDWSEDWLARFAAGLGDDATLFGCPLIGGDTMKSPNGLIISITALGSVPKGEMVPRGGAAEGDVLYISGTIGDAALGLRLHRDEEKDRAWIAALDASTRTRLLERYQLPQPRLALTPALQGHAHAALDVSDGLAGDLAKMLRLTGLTAVIDFTDVPLSAAARQALAADPALAATILSGGDDYEILCAIAPEEAAAFESAASAAGVAVARLGRAQAGASNPIFKDARGAIDLPTLAYEHF